MSFIIPSSYPTIHTNLCRLSIIPFVSRQFCLRFYSAKKMYRDKNRAGYWRVRGLSPSGNPAIPFNPPIFVGSIEIFPRCQTMSNYASEQDSPTRSENGSSHTEKLEQERNSIRDRHLESRPTPNFESKHYSNEEELFPARDRHFIKRKARIDLRSEQRAGHINSSKLDSLHTENFRGHQDESSLPTHFEMKHRPPYVKYDQRNSKYATGTKKSDNSKGLLQIEPFDICLPASRNSGMLQAPSHAKDGENQIEIKHSMEETRQKVLRPGMVLLKHYLTHSEQINIVKTCQELGLGPTGFYQPMYRDGAKLRLQMMCLGLNWNHQTRKYEDRRSTDGRQLPSIPNEFSVLVQRAIRDAHTLIKEELSVNNMKDILPEISPDICIVNFYTTSGRLGLHQDRDESPESLHKGLPVVSFSLGDSAEFLYGDQRDVEKAEKIDLESGDVLIFGGKSRHIFHGVTSIIPNSAPRALLEEARLRPGRLNLTFRQY